jgi:DNA-binding NarL/FixJ family response regulator
MIRVMLADDHTVLREGLRGILGAEPDVLVVGEASDGRKAVSLAESLRPDVIVMDVAMRELNGIEATRQIRGRQPDVRVLGLSMHSHARYVLDMLAAGASGYLLKIAASVEVCRAVRFVSQGGVYLCAHVARHVKTLPLDATGRTRARGGSAPRRRPQLPQHRQGASHLSEHRREPPSQHHAQARPARRCRADALRDPRRAHDARRRLSASLQTRTAASNFARIAGFRG